MATNTVVRSSITITDLTDGKSINSVLLTSQGLIQLKGDSSTYVPNWVTENNVITPVLLISGETEESYYELAPTWYVNDVEIVGETVPGYKVGTKDEKFALSISKNMDNPIIKIKCDGKYLENGLQTPISTEITLTRVDNASSGYAILLDTDSTILSSTRESTILVATMYEGTSKVATPTYKWQELEGGVWVDLVADVGAPNHLTVRRNMVETKSNFKVTGGISGEDLGSNAPTATIVIDDLTDIYQVVILGSDKLKPSAPSTMLSLKVMKNGEDISVSGFNILWSKLDKNGVLDTEWSATTATLEITRDMIDTRATFVVELTIT